MTSASIPVLLVEGNPDDAEMITRLLKFPRWNRFTVRREEALAVITLDLTCGFRLIRPGIPI